MFEIGLSSPSVKKEHFPPQNQAEKANEGDASFLELPKLILKIEKEKN